MAEQESFNSIALLGESLYKEKGSKFLGYAFPISDEAQFKEELARIKQEHHQARHHCYAYALNKDASLYRTSDDGEPNGTAGKPILAPLSGRDLTFSAVVVVRYFGGTKLGKGGLVRAYGTAARDAIDASTIKKHDIMVEGSMQCGIAAGERLRGYILDCGGVIMDVSYSTEMELNIAIPVRAFPRLKAHCKELGIAILTSV
jgi:uncharacterized YigZ family protein